MKHKTIPTPIEAPRQNLTDQYIHAVVNTQKQILKCIASSC